MNRGATKALGISLCCLAIASAQAAEDEIQVYTPEMDKPGELGLELHLNYVPKGRSQSSYPGEMASQNRLQVTPEFSYGLTRTLEAGLYLPMAMTQDGSLTGNGVRIRLKFIAPSDEDRDHFFWGINFELGRSAHRVSQNGVGLEIRPIVGYLDEQWLVSFNPILNMALSDGASRQPQFDPGLKVTHSVANGTRAGFEYYGEYGPTNHLLPGSQRTHMLYGVVDLDLHGFDLNFGVGRGLKNAEDGWVIKGIIAIPF
jgi:hypothetical protein